MSIIENVRTRSGVQPAIPKAPEIAVKLSQAENDLAQLEAQHGSAALDAVAGTAGATDRLSALNAKLARSS